MPFLAPAAPVLAFALALALATLTAPGHASTADIEQARTVLAAYIQRSQAYDASLADLYSDQALIRNQRRYPNGEVRPLTIPAPRYKALIREMMPLAQARGDMNRYSEPRYTATGGKVQVTLMRHSELKGYTSQLVLVMGRHADGTWKILEERSESRP